MQGKEGKEKKFIREKKNLKATKVWMNEMNLNR